jgi:hypothetical protein
MSNTLSDVNLDNPRRIILDKIEAEKFDGSKKLDIRPLMISGALSASLFHPTIFSRIMIGDTHNLLDGRDFAFTGEEFITLSLKQQATSNTNPESTFSYKFIVNNVSVENLVEDSSGSAYVLELVSVDSFINSGMMKSRGYSNTSTNMVKSILENELKTSIPILNFEDTVGITQYGFTEIKPFEKINFITSQAYNNREFITSTFSFYENFKGYNFESFENIIQRNLEANTTPLTYSYKTTPLSDREAYNTILSYTVPYRFDAKSRLSYGFFSSKVISYNLFEKRPETQTISLPEKLKDNTTKLNDNTDTRSTTIFAEKAKDIGSLTYLIPYAPPQAYNSPERVDNTNNSLLYAGPFSVLLSENTVMIRINGNLKLDVSDIINLQFPDNLPVTNPTKNIDRDLSGNYIIAEISHDIINTGANYEFETNITCIKESSLRNVNFYDSQLTTDNVNIRALQ